MKLKKLPLRNWKSGDFKLFWCTKISVFMGEKKILDTYQKIVSFFDGNLAKSQVYQPFWSNDNFFFSRTSFDGRIDRLDHNILRRSENPFFFVSTKFI